MTIAALGSGRFLYRATRTLLISAVVLQPYPSQAQESCVYADERGNIHSAATLKDVPARFRAKTTCQTAEPRNIPKVEDVELRGAQRSSSFSTPLGAMDVRWPRSAERCFGRPPTRAISEAASAVNRALRTARFDDRIKSERRDWSLIFIDRASAVSQFPVALSLGGHPGFMVPPNQIYMVVEYISPNCQPSGDVDALLTQVLLHEMGHVLEFELLEGKGAHDRKRAEGFAAWFEGYSATFSSSIPRGSVQDRYRGMIRSQADVGTSTFDGGGQDYAIASLEFEAIVARKGVSGLMSVYETMTRERCSFYEALSKKYGWDRRDLQREVRFLTTSSQR
ncbi:MAG: hypothetical protein RL518_2233 [Pseudomonadota bacterium]